jgi:hypothetical protein
VQTRPTDLYLFFFFRLVFFQFSPYSVHIRMDLLESITLATGGYLSLDLFSCSYFFFVDMVEFFTPHAWFVIPIGRMPRAYKTYRFVLNQLKCIQD